TLERVGIGNGNLRVEDLALLELRSCYVRRGDVDEDPLEFRGRSPEVGIALDLDILIRFVLHELEGSAGHGWILEKRMLLELGRVDRAQDVLGQDLESEEADAGHEASIGRIKVQSEGRVVDDDQTGWRVDLAVTEVLVAGDDRGWSWRRG